MYFLHFIMAVFVILERFAIYWGVEPGRLDICNVGCGVVLEKEGCMLKIKHLFSKLVEFLTSRKVGQEIHEQQKIVVVGDVKIEVTIVNNDKQ